MFPNKPAAKTGINMRLVRVFISHILPVSLKEIIKKIHIICLRITKRDVGYFYNEDFATCPLRNKNWVEYFCNLIIKIFNPGSIIDFGCGTGDILSPFEKKGIAVLGIDGSKSNKKHSKINQSNFLVFDLRDIYKPKKSYDICFCFEVAEHIAEKYSDGLILSLTQASSIILFTASPSLGGVDHINVHPLEWWINKFQKYDFEFNHSLTSTLKEEMGKIPDIQSWYIDNLLVFKKCTYEKRS